MGMPSFLGATLGFADDQKALLVVSLRPMFTQAAFRSCVFLFKHSFCQIQCFDGQSVRF